VSSMMAWLEALVAAKGRTCTSTSDGVIELEDALGVASNPHDLQVALRDQGLVA
jgi:hypothetical protein